MLDVAGHRQALGLGRAHQLDAGGAADRRHRCTRAPVARTSSKIVCERDRLGRRPARPAGPGAWPARRSCATPPWPSYASCGRSQTRVAERRRVLQRAHAAPACRRAAPRPARSRRSRLRSARPSRSAPRPPGRASARRADTRAPGCSFSARILSISTRPGSSSTGSVSGGQTRLVTPPATAAAISRFQHALCSWPGSRRRAARSTSPGATTQPLRIDHAVGAEAAGALADADDRAVGDVRRRTPRRGRSPGRSRGRS